MTTAMYALSILVLVLAFSTTECKRRFCHSKDSIDFDFYAGGPLDLTGLGGYEIDSIVNPDPFTGQQYVDQGIACQVEINCNLGDDAREKLLGCYTELKNDRGPFDYANKELCAKNDTDRYARIWGDFRAYSYLCHQGSGQSEQCKISGSIFNCVRDLEGEFVGDNLCEHDWRQAKYYHPQKLKY